jgi:hypothetical protein
MEPALWAKDPERGAEKAPVSLQRDVVEAPVRVLDVVEAPVRVLVLDVVEAPVRVLDVVKAPVNRGVSSLGRLAGLVGRMRWGLHLRRETPG